MKFSVLMSVYIRENPQFLCESLESVIKQSVKPAEVVIVEDGLLSNVLYDVILKYKQKYADLIRIVRLKENVGLGSALNLGVKACRYNLIARMDTDDIAKPYRFEYQLNEFKKNNNLAIVGSSIEEFAFEVSNIDSIRYVPIKNDEIYIYAKQRNPFNHMTVMFKREKVLEVGNYQDFYLCEDYYLWYRMILAKYEMKNIFEPLVMARTGSNMFARRGGYRYFYQEYKLQKEFLQSGFINKVEFMRNVTARFFARSVPNTIRGFLYKRYLRKNKI